MSAAKTAYNKPQARDNEPSPLRIVNLPGIPSNVVAQQRIIVGVEVEAYSITRSDYTIGRRHGRPRPGLSEEGERFTSDSSIGSEYNSRPFSTIREASFLLKTGLRKYLRSLYRGQDPDEHIDPLLVGTWTNRFAGTHMHVSFADETLSIEDATALSKHIHDQLPLLIAIGANSPVWNKRVTGKASNRLVRGSDAYFAPLMRGELSDEDLKEMRFTPGRRRKPATLEIRALDSNLPEFVIASVCLVKAIALRWLKGEGAPNKLNDEDYLKARADAGLRGMNCRLPWKGEWISARRYLDKFLWEHRDEFEKMDLPEEAYETFKLLKRGYNGARIIHDAAYLAKKEHPQTWQRRFAKRYSTGLELLLSGHTLRDFAATLGVSLPDTDATWLGRRTATIDG